MRVGVLGGAFDPPHAAHAAMARAAGEQLGLDRILWVPTYAPPHKGGPTATYAHRLGMTRALAGAEPTWEVSDVEEHLPRPSYTVHTLRALKRLHPAAPGAAVDWHLILGADNWTGFPRWHRPGDVLAEAALAICPRRGFPLQGLPKGSSVLHFPEMPEQSTDFREWLARDRAGALQALPPPVAAYIRAHDVYLPSGRGTG